METIIQFNLFGKPLHTRKLASRYAGEVARQMILKSFEKTEVFVFDFTDIDSISDSFADECFAKLICDFDFQIIKTKTTFRNTSPFIKATVSSAFKQRLSLRKKKLSASF